MRALGGRRDISPVLRGKSESYSVKLSIIALCYLRWERVVVLGFEGCGWFQFQGFSVV